MRILLDTHVYLWVLEDDARLPDALREMVLDSANLVLVSAVCVWEASIKQALGRLEVGPEVDLAGDIGASGFTELPVTARHAQRTADLPDLHRDPFDRLLLAQAMEEGCHLATVDERIRAYPGVPFV